MIIYIPTRGRSEKQITWAQLTPALQNSTVFVVNCDEVGRLENLSRTLRCPRTVKTIGDVRQYIIEQHDVKKYGPRILMLDDDLRFFRRRTDDQTKFYPCTEGQLEQCMEHVNEILKLYAHCGILAREGGNRIQAEGGGDKTGGLVQNTRLLRALGYDVTVLRKHGVRFDRNIVMEDFDVALQLLRLGYHNIALVDYVQDQGGSNAPGGCSLYRTLARQTEGARKLRSLHPDFVKVVRKTTVTAWQGQTRFDVVVQWKRAFNNDAFLKRIKK